MDRDISERVQYLYRLIGLEFYGEVTTRQDKPNPMGYYMKCLLQYVQKGKGKEKPALALVYKIMHLRKEENSDKSFEKDFIEDYFCFLKLRKKRNLMTESKMASESKQARLLPCLRWISGPVALLKDEDYWGTRQQLRSGKVVADALGGLDPVFGALLNPTGGRVGKGNGDILHTLLYTQEDVIAYHSAVHDASGYLYLYHGIGPGYNYIDSKWTIFNTSNPMCCQIPGYHFYRKALRRAEENKTSSHN
ncbi:uncharacterized protein LOC116292829 [Actinia tenebrosa]|uniref:Uncharacterized protein LOC116292829 n=1 Tax=Actinia tenebrosa TaxID=6105 RepID=A0A6P8HI41_ACTTE|nr:uncharacterized protein LOC116292829 [Actinia tenebrosa]